MAARAHVVIEDVEVRRLQETRDVEGDQMADKRRLALASPHLVERRDERAGRTNLLVHFVHDDLYGIERRPRGVRQRVEEQLGFLDRTPQGRIATEAARQHLAKFGFEIPQPRRTEPDYAGFWDGAAGAGEGSTAPS